VSAEYSATFFVALLTVQHLSRKVFDPINDFASIPLARGGFHVNARSNPCHRTTGKIGSSIARQLERLGRELRLLVRDPGKLSGFPAAEKIIGDYGDVESLDRAFRGVSSAFIVSGYAVPGERSKLHRNAFEAAQRAGVRYLIYLSTLGASPNSRFPMSRDHYESEGFLKETGVPHTILRDSFYSELAVQMFNEEGVMKEARSQPTIPTAPPGVSQCQRRVFKSGAQ
jgi:uncharacterized protein YbjT (DUF2867 family)